MASLELLLFLAQLPATPSSLRVNVWRKLRDAGSTSLQNGVWVLPGSDDNRLFMERLLVYVKQNGASGQIFLVKGLNKAIDMDIIVRFNADRHQEYAEFLEQCAAFEDELSRESLQQKFTFAELEENEQNLERLQRWLEKIQKRDFFKTEKSGQAAMKLLDCQLKLQDFTRVVYAREGISASSDDDLTPHDGQARSQDGADAAGE